MTLVLTCVTDFNLIQVSDRRLTWTDRTIKDVTTKTTLVCGHGLFGYTGLAKIGSESTGMWFAKNASQTKSIPALVSRIKQESDKDIATLPLPDHIKRITFAGAMWAQFEGKLRPIRVGVSNFAGDVTFRRLVEPARLRNGFALYTDGAPLTRSERIDLTRDIRKRLSRGDRAGELLELLVRFLRRVSKRNQTVGKSAIAASLPRTCVPAAYLVRSGPIDYSKQVFLYFPDGDWERGHWHGPNLACGGQAMTDVITSNKAEDEDWIRKHMRQILILRVPVFVSIGGASLCKTLRLYASSCA